MQPVDELKFFVILDSKELDDSLPQGSPHQVRVVVSTIDIWGRGRWGLACV